MWASYHVHVFTWISKNWISSKRVFQRYSGIALPWLLHVFCDVWIAEAATSIVAVLAATGNSYLIVDYSLQLQRQGSLLTVHCLCSEHT